MFEVLLQADRAMASGDLDQAERSYWQLVELDPTNAIAVTGLARISIERGDRRLARTLAVQALAIDPEGISARKILDAVDMGSDKMPAVEPADLLLLAAKRLESLGRKRAMGEETAGRSESKSEPSKTAGRRNSSDADLPQIPTEPLKERRQAGRQVAGSASAAASEAAQRAPAARPRAHQALGERAHRRLMPEDFKLSGPASDPFAAAETAAAVEAVDATDDLAIPELTEPRRHYGRSSAASSKGRSGAGSETAAAHEAAPEPAAVDDEEEAPLDTETVALRIQLVSDSAALEAAERDAALGEAELAAAGAAAGASVPATSAADAAFTAAEMESAVMAANDDTAVEPDSAAEEEASDGSDRPADEASAEPGRDGGSVDAEPDSGEPQAVASDAEETEAAHGRRKGLFGRLRGN